MGQAWRSDIPPALYVETVEEARDLVKLLLKMDIECPGEPVGFDTETHGMKIPIKNSWDDRGNWVEDAKPAPSDPLNWMQDVVTFWSLAIKIHEPIKKDFLQYIKRYHPSYTPEGYVRWCLQDIHFYVFSPFFENPDTTLVTWNGKYDGHVSWNSGMNIWSSKVMDLMIAGHLYDENLQGRMSLKDRAYEWCGLKMTKFQDLFDLDNNGNKAKEYSTDLRDLPLDRVINYASYDAYATLKLYEFLKTELSSEKAKCPPVYERDCYKCNSTYCRTPNCESFVIEPGYTMWDYYQNVEVPFTSVLWWMERRGLGIDTGMMQVLGPKMQTEIEKIEKEINRIAGRVLNLNSPKQLGEYFFGPTNNRGLGYDPVKMTTKGGSTPSTDESVMEELALFDPVAKLILRYRKVNKILGTYINSLYAMAKIHPDHRIHPNFNQYGARTGRLSANAPNSQNMPRPDGDEFGIRTMFVAPPGLKLIVGDYEQLEMRIMAHFSQDQAMIKSIRNGQDLHCFTVALMNNIPYEEVVAAKKAKKEDMTDRQKMLVRLRQAAKAIGFGLIYGAGPPRIAAQLEIDEDEARDKIRAYFSAFPGVQRFIKLTHLRCHERLFVETLLGRRRHLKDIRLANKSLASMAERESVNSIIQGTASDITKCAMLNIEGDENLNLMGAWLLNQVHDEIVMEVPEENAEKILSIIKGYMEFPFQGQAALCVPTPADLHIVDNWSEAK